MKTTNNIGCSRCGASGTILGIIFAVAVAFLFSLGFTPLIINGIWIAFGFGVLALVYVAVLAAVSSLSPSGRIRECLTRNLKCLLAGIFGTILAAIVLLSITLEITATVVIVFVGLLTFFFVFLIASLISFLNCLVY